MTITGSVSPLFIVVDGPPASGKTSLAVPLASALRLPLVAKDTIKDALMTVMPPVEVEGSRVLGSAAVAAMLALAKASPIGAVIESNLYRSRAVGDLGGLPGPVVEVFCRCEREVARSRYRRRSGTRAAGHFDERRSDDEIWNAEIAEPVAGGWPVIEVDTSRPVDIAALARSILLNLPSRS